MGGFKKFFKKVKNTYAKVWTAGAFDGSGGGYVGSRLEPKKKKPKGNSIPEYELRQGYGAAIASDSQALSTIPKAYDDAKKKLTAGKSNAIQYAQDSGKQATANAEQSMANRGLYNTTVLDNARTGVSAGVSRQVADIESMYAGIEAELGLRQNQAENQIKSNIGRLHAGLGSALAGQMNFQQAQQQQWELSQNDDEWLDNLFQIGGMAIGAYFGGPAGAAVGGQIGGSLGGGQGSTNTPFGPQA